MSRIRVLLEDGFAIKKGTGIGQYTVNLLHHLVTFSETVDVRIVKKTFLDRIPSTILRRIFYMTWLNSGLQLSLRRGKVDIVHFTNYLIPVLRLSNAKYAVTIHDLTAWKFPETLPRAYVSYIKRAIAHSIRRADLICTVSDAVKKEIIELFDVSGKKVHVVYNGISQELCRSSKANVDKIKAIKQKLGIKERCLLFIGTLEKRKNVLSLLKAFKEVKKKQESLQLVLVGRPGYGFSEIENFLSEHKLKEDVILTGYVTEEEKIALYDIAATFVFPSLYEGFGIPLVEAMVREVPIIASKIPSTEEVVGNAALYYGDPLDYEALADCILELLGDEELRQEFISRGTIRAREFSWDKVARRCLDAYKELVTR